MGSGVAILGIFVADLGNIPEPTSAPSSSGIMYVNPGCRLQRSVSGSIMSDPMIASLSSFTPA